MYKKHRHTGVRRVGPSEVRPANAGSVGRDGAFGLAVVAPTAADAAVAREPFVRRVDAPTEPSEQRHGLVERAPFERAAVASDALEQFRQELPAGRLPLFVQPYVQ